MKYFVYILECSNNTFYTGYTTDIKRRYREHQNGMSKCKYTRSFPPRRIAACWELESSLSLALQIEHSIKKMPRERKIALIAEPVKLYTWLKMDNISSDDLKSLYLASL